MIDWTGQPIFLPFYHTVGDADSLPHIRHLYQTRTARQFEQDLDFFLQYFTPVDLDFLKNNQYSKTTKKPCFHLSFDDGLREFYDIAAPILIKKGIPATIFLNADFVDNRALFFRYKASLIADFLEKKGTKSEWEAILSIAPEGVLKINFSNKYKLDEVARLIDFDFADFLEKHQPYLNTTQIQTLQKQGFTFGGHSLNHPLFAKIDLSEQIRQATESVDFTDKMTGQSTKAFAFPFTDFGVPNTFFNQIFKEKSIDISFGTAGLKRQRYAQHWQRFPMEGTDWSAAELVKTEYLYYIVKRLFGI